ncbi:MAG: DNA polymerase III subunit [Armatimonadota bacterium]
MLTKPSRTVALVMSNKHRGFDRIIGQELAKRILRRAVLSQSPAHAYLFLGPEGTGKLATAVEFAKALNCEMPEGGSACGECPVCRMIDRGNTPDVRIWSPEGKNTRIELMREMRSLAILRPTRTKWKVNIIEQGDTLNEEAANCILKLVEEPPEFVTNILLYCNRARILPTIMSRCCVVRFTPVDPDELAERLVKDYVVEPDRARFLACYSQGCPGKAIRLIYDSQFIRHREVISFITDTIVQCKPWLALALAERLRNSTQQVDESTQTEDSTADYPESEHVHGQPDKKTSLDARESTIDSLETLLLWYRDLLAVKLQGDEASLVNIDKRKQLELQAAKYPSVEMIVSALDAIAQTITRIAGNANPQIATEALFSRLASW